MNYWAIADDLGEAGWSWGYVLVIDSEGQTIWVADAHCDGKRLKAQIDRRPLAAMT